MRVLRACTDKNTFRNVKNKLLHHFAARGYPGSLVRKAFSEWPFEGRSVLLKRAPPTLLGSAHPICTLPSGQNWTSLESGWCSLKTKLCPIMLSEQELALRLVLYPWPLLPNHSILNGLKLFPSLHEAVVWVLQFHVYQMQYHIHFKWQTF